MNVAVLVPVKAFRDAKQRLTPAMSTDDRERLARWLAGRVLAAAADVPVFVVCDDEAVRDWAAALGATPLWTARLGLNGAVDDGVASIGRSGFDQVVVAHGDLPFPDRLTSVARPGTVTLVPDRHRDGTNVMSFPLEMPLAASYGPGSFRRHLDLAISVSGSPVEVRADSRLALDVDTPGDLHHPLVRPLIDKALRP